MTASSVTATGKKFGFPREARLLSGAEFKRVFGARQVVSNRYFHIHWADHSPNDHPVEGPRLGLAIARRVARRAVDRNRIRRVARETFRLQRHALRPADYVVLARAQASDADERTLKLALVKLWLRFEST